MLSRKWTKKGHVRWTGRCCQVSRLHVAGNHAVQLSRVPVQYCITALVTHTWCACYCCHPCHPCCLCHPCLCSCSSSFHHLCSYPCSCSCQHHHHCHHPCSCPWQCPHSPPCSCPPLPPLPLLPHLLLPLSLLLCQDLAGSDTV
jgi:hypothetical protein